MVGQKRGRALFYLNDPTDVLEVLQARAAEMAPRLSVCLPPRLGLIVEKAPMSGTVR